MFPFDVEIVLVFQHPCLEFEDFNKTPLSRPCREGEVAP